MLASALQAHSGGEAAPIAERLLHSARSAKLEIRRLMLGLSPVEIDALGLEAALARLARETADVHGVKCVLDSPAPVALDNNFVATQLFWIAREAVHNAVKHAAAKTVVLRLLENGGVRLSILDDGRGFPQAAGQRGGMGLRIMQYRAKLVGGDFHVGPAENGGTEVTCRVPADVTRRRSHGA
jgi:two-component system CheB/CheR fusion protein